MSDNTLVRQSARELARLIRTRAVSPLDVLDAHLAAIKALNPKLNAVVTLAEEQARDNAQRAEQAVMTGEPLGALHGLPVGIKDITQTAGIRTTFASPLLKDNVPSEDEEVVRRLKAAGAIVLAKTNTPEFACGANTNNALFGPTRNPWNPALSPAGSSGGSAVAAATGMTPRYPKPLAWDPGEVHGPLARDAEDAALMLDAMVGFSRISPISVAPSWQSALAELQRREDIKRLRIAYVSDIAGIGVEAEIDATCRGAAAALSKLGTHVNHVEFDASAGRAPYQTWRGFWMVGRQYQRLAQIDAFGPNLKGNVEAGLKLTATDWAAAEQTRMAMFEAFHRLFERYDVLLTPAAPVKPYPVEMNFPDTINGKSFENYIDWIAPAYLITLVSLPAATAPAGLSQDGLPIGIQIVAPRFEEPLILRVARLIHRASNVGRPPLAA